MRIVSFSHPLGTRLGVRLGETLVDLAEAAPELPHHDMRSFLALGREGLDFAAKAAVAAPASCRLPLGSVCLLPPVPWPDKIVCVGFNYVDHATEIKQRDLPEHPIFFGRVQTSLVAHGDPMIRPKVSRQFDFEGEMAVIIGRPGRYIPWKTALEHVAGYALFNEGSVRDYQFRSSQWFLGKNFDRSGAFGPELATADELPPGARGLRLTTRVNGEIMQEATTADMLFDVATLISSLSEAMTLAPGDVIVTGTPSGVGFAQTPPVFLAPGDICEVELEGYGILRNPVQDETDSG
jgi:2-keto-4-pentenoate hydratase/2-oxohepta-3-ene-1,7-dioic acid hydratase in catechol pathway